MNWFARVRRKGKGVDRAPAVRIYHHVPFPIQDLLDLLYPLFGAYYPFHEFLHMLRTVHHVFCAYDETNSTCIASALLNNADAHGGLYVMLFGVRSTNQGQGVGTQLLQSVIQWAKQAGYKFIFLDVHIENHKAIGLYEKVGFRKYTILPNYYAHTPKNPPHAIRMTLPLV